MSHALFDLTDRVIVITGAGGLLGQEHALAIGRAGGTPVLLDISSRALGEASTRLTNAGIEHLALEVDVTDPALVREAAREVMALLGGVWGLVNNVASNPPMTPAPKDCQQFERFSIEEWNHDLHVGLTSAVTCSRQFGDQMVSQGAGAIVNIASDLALISPDQRIYRSGIAEGEQAPEKPVSYSVVKSGLIGLTRYFATYWSPMPIRCNALLPGSVQSTQGPDLTRELTTRIPLARLASPEEYHGAVVFLLSDASAYMTGSSLVIDGGRTIW